MQERDTGLERSSLASRKKVPLSCEKETYSEDQDAADNGGVLGGFGLSVDSAQEALLRGGGVGDDDALGDHGCG